MSTCCRRTKAPGRYYRVQVAHLKLCASCAFWLVAYRRCLGMRGGKPAVVAPNHLQRQFTVPKPDERAQARWVRDKLLMIWALFQSECISGYTAV